MSIVQIYSSNRSFEPKNWDWWYHRFWMAIHCL